MTFTAASHQGKIKCVSFTFQDVYDTLAPLSRQAKSASEGHFEVRTIMAAILKGRSKPKCKKNAISKGSLQILKGTTDGHFTPMIHWADLVVQ